MRHTALILCLTAAASLLAGCDALGIETATQTAEKKDSEGRAIGSACRHAVRSIEDCFKSNPKAGKASVFAGWKDMDAYMRENEIVGMPSTASETPADAAAAHETEPDAGTPNDTKAHGDAAPEKAPAKGEKTHKS